MSSIITIGFSGRTRACLRTEFSPPIADDERRETLIHVALLTARTFAALDADTQVTFAATLREWIEDQFVACPTRLIAGDPMACLPRFASTFVAPVREYALASKGCNHNGRGVEFFLPMALVSFLHHVVVTHPHPEELLKPATALCAAVVIQPMTMENHFQAAAASLPKVAAIVGKPPERERIVTQEALPRPTLPKAPVVKPPVVKPPVVKPTRREPAIPGRPRHRRRTLVISACLAALLIMVGVQWLSVHEPELLPPGPDTASLQPPTEEPVPTPLPLPEPELEKLSDPVLTSPKSASEPSSASESPSLPPVGGPDLPASSMPEQAASPEKHPAPVIEQHLIEEPINKSSSRAIRAYQQQVRDLVEDALAQVVVIVNAVEGQVLTQFALKDVLAYGLGQTRADLRRLQLLTPPDMYEVKHEDILKAVSELERFAKELSMLRMQPPPGTLQERLSAIEQRLEESLRTVDNL